MVPPPAASTRGSWQVRPSASGSGTQAPSARTWPLAHPQVKEPGSTGVHWVVLVGAQGLGTQGSSTQPAPTGSRTSPRPQSASTSNVKLPRLSPYPSTNR
jgi:hypothetical protein